jgi:hypothetical protein
MTKRDFELIARAINKIQSLETRKTAALALAAEIQNANPRFDTGKFFMACNLPFDVELAACVLFIGGGNDDA